MKTLTVEEIAKLDRDALEAAIPKAIHRIEQLGAQLAVGGPKEKVGTTKAEFLAWRNSPAFYQWRTAAKQALIYQQAEHRNLKLERHRRTVSAPDHPRQLLTEALALIRTIEELKPEEVALCLRIAAFLEKP